MRDRRAQGALVFFQKTMGHLPRLAQIVVGGRECVQVLLRKTLLLTQRTTGTQSVRPFVRLVRALCRMYRFAYSKLKMYLIPHSHPMFILEELFCNLDDFCNWFE